MSEKILKYFSNLANRLSIEFENSGLTDNTNDIGLNREVLLRDLLLKHLPKRQSAYLGGQIFGFDAPDSKQIDIIISSDIGINYEEYQKTFTPIENVVSAISVKSNLSSAELINSLENLASIPQMNREILIFKAVPKNYFDLFIENHPSLYVFAYDGVSPETALQTLERFYNENHVAANRRPAGIIVNKKYYIRIDGVANNRFSGTPIQPKKYYADLLTEKSSGIPFLYLLNNISAYNGWLSFMTINNTKYFNSSIAKWVEENRKKGND
jgi:hypothetical protein